MSKRIGGRYILVVDIFQLALIWPSIKGVIYSNVARSQPSKLTKQCPLTECGFQIIFKTQRRSEAIQFRLPPYKTVSKSTHNLKSHSLDSSSDLHSEKCFLLSSKRSILLPLFFVLISHYCLVSCIRNSESPLVFSRCITDPKKRARCSSLSEKKSTKMTICSKRSTNVRFEIDSRFRISFRMCLLLYCF